MAIKQKNLFLYLALACFAGIIAIFVVDGYMGIYDTLRVTSGERQEVIGPDFWMQANYLWYTYVDQEGKVLFRYEVDNRRFSTYSAKVDVSVWQMQDKILDVTSQTVSVRPFGKKEIEWTLDTAQLKPGDGSPQPGLQYSIVIERGEIERRVILGLNFVKVPAAPSPTG